MQPTVDYIQSRFDEFNTRFFGGTLPPIPIKLSHARTFLGKLTFTKHRSWLFGSVRNEKFVLRINARIDLPEDLIEDTILHEMIHYYIAVNQLRDTSAHGKLFRSEMKRINAEGNRHITITHHFTDDQKAQSIIHKTRAVAVVRFSDGRVGVKVVPNQPQHIRYWHRTALRTFTNHKFEIINHTSQITNIDWYLSDNDYFAQFPSSIAMKVYLIPQPDQIPLKDAKKIP